MKNSWLALILIALLAVCLMMGRLALHKSRITVRFKHLGREAATPLFGSNYFRQGELSWT